MGGQKTDKTSSPVILPSQPPPVTRGIGKNKQLQKVHRFHVVPSVLIKSHRHFYLLKLLPSQSAHPAHVGTT